MDYQGKLFVVTGGLSGLGASTVKHFHDRGSHVAVVDLTLPDSTKLEGSPRRQHFKADVSNPVEVETACEGIKAWCQAQDVRLEAIICCAGYLGSEKTLSKRGTKLSLERFKKVVDISLTGTVDIIRHLLPQMSSQDPDADGQRGVIVTVSSAAAFDGQEGQLAYSASKGGIASMTLPLARDLACWGIRAVCIAPGLFGTNMTKAMPEKVKQSLDKSLEYPARAGRPEEFAKMVDHIVQNHMLNGTVIRLDGAARMPSRL